MDSCESSGPLPIDASLGFSILGSVLGCHPSTAVPPGVEPAHRGECTDHTGNMLERHDYRDIYETPVVMASYVVEPDGSVSNVRATFGVEVLRRLITYQIASCRYVPARREMTGEPMPYEVSVRFRRGTPEMLSSSEPWPLVPLPPYRETELTIYVH